MLALDLAGSALYIYNAYRFNEQLSLAAHSVDAAVVFYASDPKSDRVAGRDVVNLRHAADLFRRRVVRHVVCVGGARSYTERVGARMMRQFLLQEGLTPDRVLADSTSFDTHTNWHNARRMANEQGWRSVALVSDPLHLYRITDIARGDDLSLSTSFSPIYREFDARLLLWSWMRVHREIVARAASSLLPRDLHREIVRWLRNADLG